MKACSVDAAHYRSTDFEQALRLVAPTAGLVNIVPSSKKPISDKPAGVKPGPVFPECNSHRW